MHSAKFPADALHRGMQVQLFSAIKSVQTLGVMHTSTYVGPSVVNSAMSLKQSILWMYGGRKQAQEKTGSHIIYIGQDQVRPFQILPPNISNLLLCVGFKGQMIWFG